jgi:DUF3093 family protein
MNAPTPPALPAGGRYRERLWVPLRWWLLATALVVVLWIAYVVATPVLVAGLVGAAAGLIAIGVLLGYSSARVEVSPEGFRAGRALLPWAACGGVSALDAEEFRRLRGTGADARAYLVLRPYLDRAVRVDVRDSADPTPYWLVATRHPQQLAEALAEGLALVRRPGGPPWQDQPNTDSWRNRGQ